jgi:hypothetical protein
VVIAVALESGGATTAGQWIRAAKPTYPCLIDERHLVAELYAMVNVNSAVWIDEAGRIVRPTESAGASQAFRTDMDRKTYQLSAEGIADKQIRRKVYLDALRDWVAKGDQSTHVFSPDEARRRVPAPSEAHALAAANFRLGQYLFAQGHREAALRLFDEARRLHPESWNYKRQTWELEEPGKAAGPEFWAAVDTLGDTPYYAPVDMEGMPS